MGILLRSWHPVRAAIAGLGATVVYSVAMEGEMAITGIRDSDVHFIEGILASKLTGQKLLPVLAWTIHLLNGLLLAEVYAAIFKRFLPGPGWLKGALFSEVFIVGAWGLTPLADKYHPWIKSGEFPKLANWPVFLQNAVRHLVFGLMLGLLYRDGHGSL